MIFMHEEEVSGVKSIISYDVLVPKGYLQVATE